MKRQSKHLLPRWVKQEDNIRVLVNIRELDEEAVSSKHQSYGAIKQTSTSPVPSTNVSTSVVVPEVKQLPAKSSTGTLVLYNKTLYVYDGSGWQTVISGEAGDIEMVDTLPPPQRGKLVFLKPENKLYYGKDGTEWLDIIVVKSGSSLPSSGIAYELFYNTADKHLYIVDGGVWTDVTGYSDVVGVGNSLPSTAHAVGQAFFLTTNQRLYVFNGSTWVDVTGDSDRIGVGTSFPASPVTGQEYYRSDQQKHYVYDGTSWVDVTGSGGGGGSGFGTAFPASPSTGQMFYRTDLKRLYAYDGTNWVAQEAIQTTTPATPVTGEMWLNTSNNQVWIRMPSSSMTLGLLANTTPASGNIVDGTGGSNISYASRSDHRHTFRINERRSQYEGNATLYFDDYDVLWLKLNKAAFYGGSAGTYWGAIPATFQEQCRISQKSVSANNNDVVIAQHPSIPIDVFNYQVLSTESSQTDFWAEQVFRLVWFKNQYGGGNPRLRFKIYVKGQGAFTYRFRVTLNLYYLPTGAVYTAYTDISVATDTNGYGVGSGAVTVTPSYTQPLVVGVRLIRQRSLESVGTRPDNCYVLPIYSMEE